MDESQKRWKIVELSTNGWCVIDEQSTNLTKEEADKWLESYMNGGIPPSRLQVIPQHAPDSGDKAYMSNIDKKRFTPG